MTYFSNIWSFLKGKKTYIVAIAGLIWGIYTMNPQLIITCLGLMGLRDGINTAVTSLIQALVEQSK